MQFFKREHTDELAHVVYRDSDCVPRHMMFTDICLHRVCLPTYVYLCIHTVKGWRAAWRPGSGCGVRAPRAVWAAAGAEPEALWNLDPPRYIQNPCPYPDRDYVNRVSNIAITHVCILNVLKRRPRLLNRRLLTLHL